MPGVQWVWKGMKREDFIPDMIWIRRDDGWMVPLRRTDDPDSWLKIVNGDGPVITQTDDGDLCDGKGIVPSSSSSAPSVMNEMLDLLDVRDGMTILEIGSGTGYNAALLAEKTRTGHVTTIEVDPTIAEHARQALGRTGYPVTVVTGDGALGYAERAPFDRVIATASAVKVPYPWVEQTRPGGRIVLPLIGSFSRGAFLRLTVNGNGTAQGRFHGGAAFMRLRNQYDDPALWRIWDEDGADITTTRQFPREPFITFDAGFALGIRLPGWVTGERREGDGSTILLLSHHASGSWATVTSGVDEHAVCHEGPRRLWEDLEAAYSWWIQRGCPDSMRFGMTVTAEGQAFWLDEPDQVIARMNNVT